MITKYGFGDEQTWGPYTGHPNDPRTVEYYDDETPLPYGIDAGDPSHFAIQKDKEQAKRDLRRVIEDCERHCSPEADEVADDARYFLAELLEEFPDAA